jgi:hypothetical protein
MDIDRLIFDIVVDKKGQTGFLTLWRQKVEIINFSDLVDLICTLYTEVHPRKQV